MFKRLSALTALACSLMIFPDAARAAELKVGDPAPVFSTKTQEGTGFDLNERKGKWTVLYFYPKAETPGCTKQACAFRDAIKMVRDRNADVYGISGDSVEAIKKFHEKHKLNFTLLADPDAEVIKKYGTKMPAMKMAKRWTFIIDPELKIRAIDKNVDPAKDADVVAEKLDQLQKAK